MTPVKKPTAVVIIFAITLFGIVFYTNTRRLHSSMVRSSSGTETPTNEHNPKESVAQPKQSIAVKVLLKMMATSKNASWPVMAVKEELAEMDIHELSEIYHGYVNSIQVHCTNRSRVGNWQDGGWDVCMDSGYRLNQPCVVYSFGINYEWSFDDAISYHFHCDVYAFDPSMREVGNHNRGAKIHFRKIGINGSDHMNEKKWPMMKLSSLLRQNKHTDTVIDVLKLDVEGSERFAIPQMISDGSLKNVKQLCFEIHLKDKHPTKEDYLLGLEILAGLYKAQFRIFHTNRNLGPIFHPDDHKFPRLLRSLCHEICMLRVK